MNISDFVFITYCHTLTSPLAETDSFLYETISKFYYILTNGVLRSKGHGKSFTAFQFKIKEINYNWKHSHYQISQIDRVSLQIIHCIQFAPVYNTSVYQKPSFPLLSLYLKIQTRFRKALLNVGQTVSDSSANKEWLIHIPTSALRLKFSYFFCYESLLVIQHEDFPKCM